MREEFTTLQEWLYAAVVEGGCGLRQRKDYYWAENWDGRNCGEYYPSKEQGYLEFI